jgi:energy-converting hydrogenase Eha subunit C
VIKFTSGLPRVGGSLRVLRLPPPLKLVTMILLKVALSTKKSIKIKQWSKEQTSKSLSIFQQVKKSIKKTFMISLLTNQFIVNHVSCIYFQFIAYVYSSLSAMETDVSYIYFHFQFIACVYTNPLESNGNFLYQLCHLIIDIIMCKDQRENLQIIDYKNYQTKGNISKCIKVKQNIFLGKIFSKVKCQ